MAPRIGLCAAMVAMTALAACGGSSGSSSSNDGPDSGLPSPGDIVGASPDYLNSLTQELNIAGSALVAAGRTDLPLSGSATYSGFGSIFDASLTTDDNTAAELRNRSVVTDVNATVNFGTAGTVTVIQNRFRDVDGNAVSGSVNWTGTFSNGDQLFTSTVTGDVGGTRIASGTDRASVGFFGDATDSAILGVFQNAPTTPGGWLQGTRASGDFAATSN